MLDINTAFFLWAMEALTLAALLAAVWLYDRTQGHYGHWALGFAAHGFGVVLIGLRGDIPDILSIEIANTIVLSSFLFWISGVLALSGRTMPGWAGLPMLIWIAGMLLPPIREEIAYRIALYNVAAACGYLMLASVAFRFDVAERRFRRLLVGIWTLEALIGLVVAAVTIVAMPESIQAAPLAAISAATSIFCFIAMIMTGAKIAMDRSELRLQHLIRTDPLTGALNRRGMVEGFGTMKGRKADADRILALALFDLDHFKTINDTHGHQAGDAVLVAFAALCRTLVPSGGVFGRTGGEEFMALVEVRDIREAALVAETIRQAFAAARIETDRGQVSATVSIGIATATAADGDLDRLMSNSDRALYKAKAGGRNRSAVLVGDKVLTIPAEGPEALDEQADRQVAVLKRLVAEAAPQAGLSML